MHEAFTDVRNRDWDTGIEGTVRLAVVGCGGFARGVVLPSLDDCDYLEPTVGVSGSEGNRSEVADRFDLETTDYDGYKAGTLANAYDAVYVATPNRRHLPHVETAASQGKAVICEKPLEATTQRAEQLVETCTSVPLMTAYRMQTDPLVRRLREFLQAGGIGSVRKLVGDFSFPVLMGSRGPDQWRLDEHLAGGGALMDVGVYPLNTSRFLLDADPGWVDGHTRTSGPYADVDRDVAFSVGFDDIDVVGSFTASFAGHPNANLTIHGEAGMVRLFDAFQPDRGRRLVVEADDQSYELVGAGGGEIREEFDYFAHAVLSGSEIGPDGADGLTDVRLMRELYAAAK
jgi:xylose dehydrogenase (NAD/NADP)